VSIHINVGDDWIRFTDAPGLEVLDTGFAWARGGVNRAISILDRGRLEGALRKRDAFSMQLTGDALGSVSYETGYSVSYETGYKESPGDPLGRIHQQIKTMALRVALGKDGLEILVSGDLDDYDPVTIAEHREKRRSQLQPRRAYALHASMPWAMLAVMGFSFADRVWNL
jgi:hypothetical protein